MISAALTVVLVALVCFCLWTVHVLFSLDILIHLQHFFFPEKILKVWIPKCAADSITAFHMHINTKASHSHILRAYISIEWLHTQRQHGAKCPRFHLCHFCMSVEEMSHFQWQLSHNYCHLDWFTLQTISKITINLPAAIFMKSGWGHTVNW